MNDHGSYNDNELAALEQELKKFGVPYQEPKPDPSYWASFRVRVMERTERKRGVALLAEWVHSHLLGSSLIGAGLASAILLATLGLPVSESSRPSGPAAVAQRTVETPSTPVPNTAPPTTTLPSAEAPLATTETAAPVVKHRTQHARSTNARHTTPASDETPLLAYVEPSPVLQGTSESEYPVSLNELSADELEFVYDGLQSLDSAE
jgi:hypothetical protein